MNNSPILQKATDFIWKNARLIDRLRFEHLFLGGYREPVVAALAAYKNADGGFGNTLEPDLRGPNSQPVPVWSALAILDEVDALTTAMVGPILNYLAGITLKAGGVPFVLQSAKGYPHAPWWETGDNPPAALNPTAGIAGFLHKHNIRHAWLNAATDFCWKNIEGAQETSPYELRCILQFLENVADQGRAEKAFIKIRTLVGEQGFISLDPEAKGEVHFPLNFAPTPDSIGRRLFDDETIENHLIALIRKQQLDGGWTVNFPIWTPVTEFEWRGIHTIEAIKTLKAYGKLR
jgi:hypothetical protein